MATRTQLLRNAEPCRHVALSIVDGKIVVRDGTLTTVEKAHIVLRQRALARTLARNE